MSATTQWKIRDAYALKNWAPYIPGLCVRERGKHVERDKLTARWKFYLLRSKNCSTRTNPNNIERNFIAVGLGYARGWVVDVYNILFRSSRLWTCSTGSIPKGVRPVRQCQWQFMDWMNGYAGHATDSFLWHHPDWQFADFKPAIRRTWRAWKRGSRWLEAIPCTRLELMSLEVNALFIKWFCVLLGWDEKPKLCKFAE